MSNELVQTVTEAPQAPVEPETPVQPLEGGEAAAPAADGQGGEPDKQDDAKGWQRRVNRLTSEKYRLKAQAEQTAQENAALRAALEARAAAAQGAAGEPRQEQFQSYEDFLQAKAAYTARQETGRALSAVAQQQARHQQQMMETQLEQTFAQRTEKAREQYADFDEALEWMSGQVPAPVVSIIAASENGAHLAYYLGKHPEELERIRNLPPVLQIREAALLETKATPQSKTTAAPKPINPVKSTEGGKSDWYRPDMTDKDWHKFYLSRKGRR